jgi:hypothetical protein
MFAMMLYSGDYNTLEKFYTTGQPETKQMVDETYLSDKISSLKCSWLHMIVSNAVNTHYPQGRRGGQANIATDRIGVARWLLKKGADVYAQDMLGNTIVQYGATNCTTETTIEIVRLCLEASRSQHFVGQEIELVGLKTEALNGRRGNVLKGWENGRRVVELAAAAAELAAGAGATGEGDKPGDKPKVMLVKPENLRLLNSEIKAHPNLLDIVNRMGENPLIGTLQCSTSAAPQFLLDNGADIDLKIECYFGNKTHVMTARTSCFGGGGFQTPFIKVMTEHIKKVGRSEMKGGRVCDFCSAENPPSQCSTCRMVW